MVEITTKPLSIHDLKQLLFEAAELSISQESYTRIEASHEFLKNFSRNKIIYGINTGFGPMAQHRIAAEDQQAMQVNLIRSHASGMGPLMSSLYTKATMIARLNTLCLGYSGVHRSAAEVLLTMINKDVHPAIPEHGGVGASGDLVQLAHLALVLIGEGKAEYLGELQLSSKIFSELGISPMQIKIREGLAIMNGTSAMTGIGLVNLLFAQRALEWAVQASLLICEIVDAFDDYFSPQLHHSKKHRGQRCIANTIFKHFHESAYARKRDKELYEDDNIPDILENKVQEYYSIRCVPQILGPVLDTVRQCQRVLMDELNSANDNPIVDVHAQNVFHGGNFHGDYVALEMDKLKIAITKLSMLAERQLNFLMNPSLNRILPPFVNHGTPGLNFGMQGIQFTATSTTAENQMLANPMYVHSIPNNNDNQDVVSMGANAAHVTKRVIDNTFQILSIELLAIVQAVDFLEKRDGLSPSSQKTCTSVREIIPEFAKDISQSENLEKLKEFMMLSSPLAIEDPGL